MQEAANICLMTMCASHRKHELVRLPCIGFQQSNYSGLVIHLGMYRYRVRGLISIGRPVVIVNSNCWTFLLNRQYSQYMDLNLGINTAMYALVVVLYYWCCYMYCISCTKTVLEAIRRKHWQLQQVLYRLVQLQRVYIFYAVQVLGYCWVVA